MKRDEIVTIDESALDVEWANQPRLALTYGEKLADARHEHETAKARLELIQAELALKVRQNPTEYGLGEKATEAGVSAAIIANETFQRVQRACFDARHKVDVLVAAMTAIDSRKKALENLVQLHVTSYYSEPREPRQGAQYLNERRKDGARVPTRRAD